MDVTITPDEMKALEQAFMRESGVPSALLMEHAAQGICSALERHIPGGRALFLCGPGNNGGDGYAAARLWTARGGQAMVWELSSSAHGDAGMNRSLALQAGVRARGDGNPLVLNRDNGARNGASRIGVDDATGHHRRLSSG